MPVTSVFGPPLTADLATILQTPSIEYATLVLAPAAGGLNPRGMFDAGAKELVPDVSGSADRRRALLEFDGDE